MKLGPDHVLAGAAALAPPVAVLAPLGLAPLLATAAAGLLALRLLRRRGAPWRALPLAALFASATALALAGALWSIDPAMTLGKVPQFAATLACGYIIIESAAALDPAGRARLGHALIGGIFLAFALLAVERVFDFPIRRLSAQGPVDRLSLLIPYKRGLTTLVLMIWPAALVLWRGWRPGAALLLAAMLVALSAFDSGSARVAVMLGLAAAAGAAVAPRLASRALAVALIVYIAAAPVLHANWINPAALGIVMPAPGEPNHPYIPRSGYHRLLIWQFASERIAERPVRGWGLDSSRRIPGGDRLLDYAEQAMPLHPHNAVLQIWLELGLGGALLLAVLVGWIFGRMQAIARRPDFVAGLALTAAMASTACLSFGIWQSWWLAAIFFSAALFVGVNAPGGVAATQPARQAQ